MKSGDARGLIPSIDSLSKDEDIAEYFKTLPHPAVMKILRETVDAFRSSKIEATKEILYTNVKNEILNKLNSLASRGLRRVVNATGVVLHTNLGRAPLSRSAVEKIVECSRGYSNLEYDVANGARGDRNVFVESLIVSLTGAEAALTVNNNAAAVFLALNTLCAGREAIVSRGEVVEIGDSFRIMDIAAESGCAIRECGTANRTYPRDYEAYINERTGAFLKVHRSNFKVEGFTCETGLSELSVLRSKYGSDENPIYLINDMGSGLLMKNGADGKEPTVSEALAAGADIVTFSGDKLLGGPQAGIIAGKKNLVAKIKRNPLYRCMRIDKLCLAALEATLSEYVSGSFMNIPAARMMLEPNESVRARAEALFDKIKINDSLNPTIVPNDAAAGGGALPGGTLKSFAVRVAPKDISAFEAEKFLRTRGLPIIAMVRDGTVFLDLRTVDEGDVEYIADTLNCMISDKTEEYTWANQKK